MKRSNNHCCDIGRMNKYLLTNTLIVCGFINMI